MKKFIAIFISCSLALAAGAMAQQDESSPAQKKKHQGQGQAPQEAAAPAQHQAAPPAHSAHHQDAGMKQQGAAVHHPKPETPATAAVHANPDVNAKSQAEPHKQGQAAHQQAAAAANDTAHPDGNANPPAEHHNQGHAAHQQAAATAHDTANPARPVHEKATANSAQVETASEAHVRNPQTNKQTAQGNKPDIQSIKAKHANFHAEAKPQQVPAVTFNQSRTISGSENWQGQNYTVFRSYRPAIHDQVWYRSHYNRIELIGGGYYFFDAGYWYPAWGYAPSAQYYVYDGPIYAGRQAEPPDRVIADVQASLQEMGYYKGEVDGLLGPLTREALTGYQADNGLYTTAAIDQPTLDSLGI